MQAQTRWTAIEHLEKSFLTFFYWIVTESNFRPEKKSKQCFEFSCWTRYLGFLYASEQWVRAANLLAKHWEGISMYLARSSWSIFSPSPKKHLKTSLHLLLTDQAQSSCKVGISVFLSKKEKFLEGIHEQTFILSWGREEEFARDFSEPTKGAGLAVGEEHRQQSASLASLTFPMEHVDYVFWGWLNKSMYSFAHSFYIASAGGVRNTIVASICSWEKEDACLL